MLPVENIIEILKDYLEEEISYPTGIDAFDSIVTGPPANADDKILAVYIGTGARDVSSSAETVMVQAQLPRIMDPIKYHTALTKLFELFQPVNVHADSLGYSYESYFPGEVKDGGMSAFLIYEVTFQGQNDDCTIYDEVEGD